MATNYRHPSTPHITLIAAEAIGKGIAVKVNSSGQCAIAGATEDQIGVTINAVASGEAATIALYHGTVSVTADQGWNAGARIFKSASGKFSDDSVGDLVGIALEPAAGDGSIVPIAIVPPIGSTIQYGTPIAVTAASRPVLSGESGATFTNAGAAGVVTFALPPATVGLRYRFFVQAAHELRLDPSGTQTISLPATGVQQAGGKYITADAIGERVEIECIIAGTWHAIDHIGTWTVES